jgi:hypothetical protein
VTLSPTICLSCEFPSPGGEGKPEHEHVDDDELVEVTPQSIRIRKRHLTENDRKRAMRGPKED